MGVSRFYLDISRWHQSFFNICFFDSALVEVSALTNEMDDAVMGLRGRWKINGFYVGAAPPLQTFSFGHLIYLLTDTICCVPNAKIQQRIVFVRLLD